MARIKNQESYDEAKERLLSIGVSLIRSKSFKAVGINDVLKTSGIPKGSFYHYFKDKESYGIEVAEHYHAQQMEMAHGILRDESRMPKERLLDFFASARKDFAKRSFVDGCLMCNLSTELGDNNLAFREVLAKQWDELADELAVCIAELDVSELGLEGIDAKDAADWLLNGWSGALTRMKVTASDQPLRLFEKMLGAA